LSTHPEPGARVAEVQPTIDRLTAAVDPASLRVNRAGYLDHVDGLRFGDNPEDGIVRGNEFFHPPLRFAMRFPEGWEVQNSDAVVMAQQPGQDIYMLLQLAESAPGADLRLVAEDGMREAGYQLRSGGETQINGLDAFIGTYGGPVNGVGEVTARMAYIRHGRSLYVFGGIGPAEGMSKVEPEVDESIRSFRPLSQDEADSIRPNEIALYTVRDGDTWQSIAQRGSDEVVQATTLAIMNGYPVNEQPQPGDMIKIVVPGEPVLQDLPRRRR
jgi:predicted Zn-dependent protease